MTSEVFTGRVKWFNNKTGYGFITVTDGQRSGSDIFVHHSAINVEGQYKYLVQGEYVEFTIVNTPSEKHECQAGSVNGIKGGKLMCTTRHENKVARTNYKKSELSTSAPTPSPVSDKKPYSRSVAPKRETATESVAKPKQSKPTKTLVVEEQGEWIRVVPRSSKADAKPNSKSRGKDKEAK